MKHSVTIGEIEFDSKKDALSYFKRILNAYEVGSNLTGTDLNDVLALLKTHPRAKEKIGIGIRNIRVSKLNDFSGRGFELTRIDGSKEFFSYTKTINSPKSDFSKFKDACRQAIQSDLIKVKQDYFRKHAKDGRVKCQESKKPTKYEDLHTDHRLPNTFSVIVDRFVELHRLDLTSIEYIQVNGAPDELADTQLKKRFLKYHKEKANLRLIRKDLNLSRTYLAKSARQKKDLKIE